MSLRDFLLQAHSRLHHERSLDLFLHLRYRELGHLFPHGVFSVGQASLDFFDTALAHLNGAPFDDSKEKPSEYEMNYRRWILSHRA
jgi:hypothetical protein